MSLQDGQISSHAFLFADPAAHSLSPYMHRAAFIYAGLSGDYEAIRVVPNDLQQAVEGLKQPHIIGANLSLPHKEKVLPFLDDLTVAARSIGAVNTIINKQGYLLGDNTDAAGLLASLKETGLTEMKKQSAILIFGAGGAARAAVYTALISMQKNVYIVNRTLSRAQVVAMDFNTISDIAQAKAIALSEVPWKDIGLVINSSSVGLDTLEESPIPDFYFTKLVNCVGVYDMIYKPLETRLMLEARAAGLKAENGLGMLAHQARLGFEAWTSIKVPNYIFIDALNQQINKQFEVK